MSIAEPEANDGLFVEFLDEYFVECDEHLTVIRRSLLTLEEFVDQPRLDRALLDDLFRSFHTLKGISGMVGVREAEQLSHQMESYLRLLRDGQLTLMVEGIDGLISGTNLIEKVVSERRTQTPASDISPVMKQLTSIVSAASARNAGSPAIEALADAGSNGMNVDESARLARAIENGMKAWRFEFIPSPDLAQRGINVNVVRARLQQIGEMIHAAPRILPQAAIAFEFIVVSAADETIFEPWREDGLTFVSYQSLPPTAPATTDGESRSEISPSLRSLASSNVVRVDLARIDDLMRMVGDLVVSRSRLEEDLKQLETTLPAPRWRPLQETNLAMARQLRDLRRGIMRVRMVPIGEIFERMRFVVRDLANEYNKKFKLELNGQQTETDKLLVERMMDPMLHLVRNAVSHGLESTSERIAQGKSPEGTISLRASAVAEMVVIEVEDDGRGIDAELVARRARTMGLISPESDVDDAALLDLICAPGFSTREEADRASGRGVGMNVVKNTILGLGGTLDLNTEAGRGTRFTIQLPLTLAIADALIVAVGDQRFAIPQSSVREVIEIEFSAIKVLENNEIITYRGGILPLLRLARHFRLAEKARKGCHAFVVGTGLNAVGVVVDRVLGQREIVVRAITDPVIQVAGVAGATELGDGRIVLILEATGLTRAVQMTKQRPAANS